MIKNEKVVIVISNSLSGNVAFISIIYYIHIVAIVGIGNK